MREFVVELVDLTERRVCQEWHLPNLWPYEGAEAVYRQIFPPHQSALTLVLGVSGPTLRTAHVRPNPVYGDVPFDHNLTFLACTDSAANEGGAYTDEMRQSFGYQRHTASFNVELIGGGAIATSGKVSFSNNHEWQPQSADDWDFPWTPDVIEQPPPAWEPDPQGWEPIVGYPWQRPRKRSTVDCNPENPSECLYPYMRQWDSSGELDWLHDFRKMGGFPITLVFLADPDRECLIAAAKFHTPVLLRPGLSLYVSYRVRLVSRHASPPGVTADFANRALCAIFAGGSRYSTFQAQPVLFADNWQPNRNTTYSDVAPRLVCEPLELDAWTVKSNLPDVPPYVESNTKPEWINESGQDLGPIGWIAVWGVLNGQPELAWMTALDSPVTLAPNDRLSVPDGIQFRFESA